MIISFGWTTQYLPPDGPKDTTRRIWKPRTLASWQKAWDEGRYAHVAVDKCMAYGGKKIGIIYLIERPFEQPLWEMPKDDLIREGGMCSSVSEFVEKYFKGDFSACPAVVRFLYLPFDQGAILGETCPQVHRIHETADGDSEIEVTLLDGFTIRFFEPFLTDVQYVWRAQEARQIEYNAGLYAWDQAI